MTTSPFQAFTISNLKNGAQYFVNSFDYKINKISLIDKNIQMEFGRPFAKVKYFYSDSHKKWMKKYKKPMKTPEKKHFKSVLKLINQGEEVWVLTPEVKKDKGILVDVFSKEGLYKDKFYLPIPGLKTPHLLKFNIIDDKIVVLEKDDEDNHLISLYKIKK